MNEICCPHCGSRWRTDKDITSCPLCGKKLNTGVAKTYTDFNELLCDIRDEYGIEVFENAPKAKGILKDKAPGLKENIKLFSLALDSSAFKDYYSHEGDSAYLAQLKKDKYILMKETFISEENADIVVDWYCVLLGIQPIQKDNEEELRRKAQAEEIRKRKAEEERRAEEMRMREAEEARRRMEAEKRRIEEDEERRCIEEEERWRVEEYQIDKEQKKQETVKTKKPGEGMAIFFSVIFVLYVLTAVSSLFGFLVGLISKNESSELVRTSLIILGVSAVISLIHYYLAKYYTRWSSTVRKTVCVLYFSPVIIGIIAIIVTELR